MGSTRGLEITVHNRASSLPVPTTDSQGAKIRSFGPSFDVADIAILPDGGTNFVLSAPVYLYAYLEERRNPGLVANWYKMETLEPTSMDLSAGGAVYRVYVSPWCIRLALAAPSWVSGANESVNVLMKPWVGA